ncbi:hypothetical protein HPB50_024676 [Hyalomma asiaticum]|uniref:Uncharacterized protein n=1 Tax=Hyalomma asiaticum TaxID=266040 RepID=A0ACB7SC33_HYAAI|nr:hypothetical protein HPB50_024676 [Hyalomma asiaticum]
MHVSCATLIAALTRCVGLRLLLIVSTVLVAGILFVLRPLDHVVFCCWSPCKLSATKRGVLHSLCLLILAYSEGPCHVPPEVISALLPLERWRYQGDFASVQFDVDLLRAGDFKHSLLASGLALLLSAATIPFVPETEGLTLADIHRDDTPSDPSLRATSYEQQQVQKKPQIGTGSPGNAAMEALRRWRPAVKGATPTAAADDPTAGGLHERAMMAALLVNISAGTALGYASVSMPGIELEPWYGLQHTAPPSQWAADILLLGAAVGALLSGETRFIETGSTPSDPSLRATSYEQQQVQKKPQIGTGSPGNAAMEALRRWRPAVKGATPTAAADDPTAGGLHERAMMAALLVNISAGTALGYASVSMPGIELEPWYGLQHTAPPSQWAADILLLGAAVGALLSGLLLHLLGHRRTLLLCAFGLINAWICVVVSNSVTMLLVGRATCGLWLGVSANSVSLYVIDVAPPTKRTFFGGITEVALSVGMLAAYVLSGLEWQISAVLFMLAPTPVFALQNYILESPRWFVTKGRYRDSNTAMVRLYGDDVPTDFRYSRTGDDSNVSTVGRQKVARQVASERGTCPGVEYMGRLSSL